MHTVNTMILRFLLVATALTSAVRGQGSVRGAVEAPIADEAKHLLSSGGRRHLIHEASNSASLAETSDAGRRQYCIKRDDKLKFNLTSSERNNAKWMNEARAEEGLPALKFSADLVREAQRHAKAMAASEDVKSRDHLTQGVWCDSWEELGEYVIGSRSVRKTGAFADLMSGGGEEYVLYEPYDRMGIGIAKNGKWFYMAILFKNSS